MLDRRAILLSLAFVTVAPALAAQPVYRVGGAVTLRNWGGLRAFLLNSEGQVVGLKISFRSRKDGPDGSLIAAVSDGAFDGYLAGGSDLPGGDPNIHAERGFSTEGVTIDLDGFFRVENGGMHQGIIGLGLTPIGASSVEGTVKDIDIDRLRADLVEQ